MKNHFNRTGAIAVSRTTELMFCALFTALTAVCSWISLPLPLTPVPVNLATLAVMLSGLLLGAKYGTLAQLVYVLLGSIGAPVFSGGTGGLGVVAGPTGGYIIGYILCALVCGLLSQNARIGGSRMFVVRAMFSMIAGTFFCYLAGTLWFMHLTGNGLVASLSLCVIPFLPGDLLKMILATMLAKRLPKNLFAA